jgi:hypothetical protein
MLNMPWEKLRGNLSHIFFYIWLLRHRVQDYVYCIENYSITSGETTNRALSGCVQIYQYLENTYVIKIQCNREILKENYANFTYILPITIVNSRSFIKRRIGLYEFLGNPTIEPLRHLILIRAYWIMFTLNCKRILCDIRSRIFPGVL